MIILSNLQILEQQIQKKPIKNSSRVPRYQNPLKVVGFCDFQVASPPYREGPWGGWMFFSFFSCAKKRTSICFFLCVKALGIPKGDACYLATNGTQESKRTMFLCFFLLSSSSSPSFYLPKPSFRSSPMMEAMTECS